MAHGNPCADAKSRPPAPSIPDRAANGSGQAIKARVRPVQATACAASSTRTGRNPAAQTHAAAAQGGKEANGIAAALP